MKAILGIAILSLALHCGAKGGNTNTIQYAAWSGDLEKVKKYLADNPKLLSSREGTGILTVAAENGQSEMVDFLVSHGADVNEKGFFNMTPLAQMAFAFRSPNDEKYAEIATILIAHGATVDAVDQYHDTPLLHAVESENYHLAEVLIKNGANQRVTYKSTYGSTTPLHMAILHGNSEQVAMLLKYNPPLDAVDRDGRTPLLLAELYDKTNVVAMIREISHDTNAIPSLADMRAIGKHIAEGDESAMNDLAKVDDDLQNHIKPDYNQYPHVPDPWIMVKFGRINTALKVLGEEVGKGNVKSFPMLKKYVAEHGRHADLALEAFSYSATAGNQEALEILLHLDTSPSGFNSYLCRPAAANIEPAVDYFVDWLQTVKSEDRGGLMMEATNALASASAKGNLKAQTALEKFAANPPEF
jgi:ankyrin repeat protein